MEILGDLVRTAVVADVFPQHKDIGIPVHFLIESGTEGIKEKGFSHSGVGQTRYKIVQGFVPKT
ncbi:MAG: hypothetical protein OHK0012_02320 [Synechococcales cyanobacterium]